MDIRAKLLLLLFAASLVPVATIAIKTRSIQRKNLLMWWYFCPSLLWFYLRHFVHPERYKRVSKIEDGLYLGMIPFQMHVADLKKQNIGAVISLVEDWELALMPNMKKHGFEHLHIAVADYTGVPTQDDLLKCAKFIQDQNRIGKIVYVHCKAGVGRSAAAVLGYLMLKHNLSLERAHELLKERRPHISIGRERMSALQTFYLNNVAQP